MTTSNRTIEWTSQAGQPIVVTVTVSRELRERVVNADGDVIHTGKMELICSTALTATVGGQVKGESNAISDAPKGAPKQIVGVIGCVAMTATNRARIESAIAEAEAEATTPEISAYIAARETAINESNKAYNARKSYLATVRAQEGE